MTSYVDRGSSKPEQFHSKKEKTEMIKNKTVTKKKKKKVVGQLK